MRVWVLMENGTPVGATRYENVATRFYGRDSKHRDFYSFILDQLDHVDMPEQTQAEHPLERQMRETSDEIESLKNRFSPKRRSSLLNPRR